MDAWRRLDDAAPDGARTLLARCCGSRRWVERMLERRPFGSRDALLSAARDEWFGLSDADWREAFADHPTIGDREALQARFATTRHLAAREQSGVDAAPESVIAALADDNRAYEKKFGFIFIVCATGKTAVEMLDLLRSRLPNSPATEIRVAADEHAQITALRLESLIPGP